MDRANKDPGVAALHRGRILDAAERLFAEKGFERASVDDLSRASGYSRRTIYAYFAGKDALLSGVLARGLVSLRDELDAALGAADAFLPRFRAAVTALRRYWDGHAYAAGVIRLADADGQALREPDRETAEVLRLGAEVNGRLTQLVRDGQWEGAVRAELNPALTACLLWTQLERLFVLARTKGGYLERTAGIGADALPEYGVEQLLHGIAAHGPSQTGGAAG